MYNFEIVVANSSPYFRVVWFNLGNHHVPHSGDIPNTLQHTSASSVWFVPYNFHDRDPSRGKSETIRLPKPKEQYLDLGLNNNLRLFR